MAAADAASLRLRPVWLCLIAIYLVVALSASQTALVMASPTPSANTQESIVNVPSQSSSTSSSISNSRRQSVARPAAGLTTRVSIQHLLLDDRLIGMTTAASVYQDGLVSVPTNKTSPSSQRRSIPAPLKLTLGLITVSLPSKYAIVREQPGGAALPFEFPMDDGGEQGQGQGHGLSGTGLGLTTLTCGSHTFESSPHANGLDLSGSSTPSWGIPKGLLPLNSPTNPSTSALSPLAQALSSLWGRSDYLASRLVFVVALRASLGSETLMNQLDPKTFSELVLTGQCQLHFTTKDEQRKTITSTLPAESTPTSASLLPGSYVLVDTPSSHTSDSKQKGPGQRRRRGQRGHNQPDTLDGLTIPVTHRRSLPASDAPSLATPPKASVPSSTLANAFLYRQTTCRRAHRALGIVSAFLASRHSPLSSPLSLPPSDSTSLHPVFLQTGALIRKRKSTSTNNNGKSNNKNKINQVEGVYAAPDTVLTQVFGRPVTLNHTHLATLPSTSAPPPPSHPSSSSSSSSSQSQADQVDNAGASFSSVSTTSSSSSLVDITPALVTGSPILNDESVAFVSVDTMVKGTNFGALAEPIVKAVFNPLISITAGKYISPLYLSSCIIFVNLPDFFLYHSIHIYVSIPNHDNPLHSPSFLFYVCHTISSMFPLGAFLALTQYFMGKELPSILDLGLHNLVSKELVGSLTQPVLQVFPFSITEVMQDQLPPLVAHTVAEDLVQDVTPRITRIVTERLHRVISRNLVLDSLRPATRQMNNQLGSDTAHILSLSLAATITPALLHTLSHNPQQDYFCYYCETKQLYCKYCHATRGRIARQNFYAEFYSGFYARYYTAYYRKYFVELEDAKQLEERMREHQVHYDQGWKQTPRLVLEEMQHVRDPTFTYPRQTPPPAGVAIHGPGGNVAEGYQTAAATKYDAFG